MLHWFLNSFNTKPIGHLVWLLRMTTLTLQCEQCCLVIQILSVLEICKCQIYIFLHIIFLPTRCRLIDGTEVIQETYGRAKNAGNDDIPRRGPDMPPTGHHDVISDISICQTSQCFIITCSRDGVVKVWK